MTHRAAFCWLAVVFLASCRFAAAQTFQFRVQQGSLIVPVSEGSTVNMTVDAPGRTALADVTATYAGTSGAMVSAVVVGGSPDFGLTSVPRLPQSLRTTA